MNGPTVQTISGLTSAQVAIAFTAYVQAALQEAYDPAEDGLFYSDVARTMGPDDFYIPDARLADGELNPFASLPKTAVFGQLMPMGPMEQTSGAGSSNPLVRQAQTVELLPYQKKVHVNRWDFGNDIFRTLAAAPRTLRRVAEKNPDFLVASLLQQGNSVAAWFGAATGKNFFDSAIPEDLAGNSTGRTFTNYRTNFPLTAPNIAKQIGAAAQIRLGDNTPANVRFDTLLVPTAMMYDADATTLLGSIVYSGVAGTGGLFPGQTAGTAAQGDNIVAIRKYIKKVVYADVLSDGTASGDVTWYLLDSRRFSIGFARALAPAYAMMVDPNSASVFNDNELRWKVNNYEGAGYLLPQYIAKFRGN